MPADYWLILPLFVAVAAGWWLGRRQLSAAYQAEKLQQTLSREYFVGLDQLINEQTDEAIESFIRALEINSDTIPVHLTLAKLLRRKGEIEQAVSIHQRLLARPDLTDTDFVRIQIALAKDYQSLGLLDRAENLLRDIIQRSKDADVRGGAQLLLIKLYEQEREWQSALDAARQLAPTRRADIQTELAHYCCELAREHEVQGRVGEAEALLRKAHGFDAECPRVSLVRADLLIRRQQWGKAVKALHQVLLQDTRFVPETIALLERCYTELNRPDEFACYLKKCLKTAPSATVIMALARCISQRRDVYAAGRFLTEELKKRPSVKGFNLLIDLHIAYGSSSARQSLTVLRGLTGQLEQSKPKYQCGHCGFSGRVLHWQCPSCRQWGTTEPVQGLEGE